MLLEIKSVFSQKRKEEKYFFVVEIEISRLEIKNIRGNNKTLKIGQTENIEMYSSIPIRTRKNEDKTKLVLSSKWRPLKIKDIEIKDKKLGGGKIIKVNKKEVGENIEITFKIPEKQT